MTAAPISPRQELARIVWAEDQADRCANLWREVIWRIVLDLEPGWGISPADVEEARSWFEDASDEGRANRQALCTLAGIGEGALLNAYRDGRLRARALTPIGRKRWETRMRNNALREAGAQPSAPNASDVTTRREKNIVYGRNIRRREMERRAQARARSREELAMVR